MSKSVQSALEARKARKNGSAQSEYQARQNKISAALETRDNRMKSNVESTKAELNTEITKEIEAIKTLSIPNWGEDSVGSTLNSTRQNTINVGNLIRKVEANRKYLGDKEADNYLSILKQLDEGYKSHLSISQIRSTFKSEDEYNDYRIGWLNPEAEVTEDSVAARQKKYQDNKSRIETLSALRDEKNKIETSAYTRSNIANSSEFASYGGSHNIYGYDETEASTSFLPYDGKVSGVVYTKEEQKRLDEINQYMEELERLEAENRMYERTLGVMDKYYTPITDEFLANSSYRDYTNASREELWEINANEDYINNLLASGGYTFDANGNIINVTTGEIQYTADDLSRAMYKTATESGGGIFSKKDYISSTDQYYNSLVQDKLGMFLSSSEDDIVEAYNEIASGPGDDNNLWAETLRDGDAFGWKHLTEREIQIYYDLYKREGQESAYRYLEAMTTELTRRATQARAEKIASASGLEKVFLNAASIPMNVLGGGLAFLDDTVNVLQGKDINPYSQGHSWQNDASAIRYETAKDIDELVGVSLPWLDFSMGDAYQSIMSFTDQLVGRWIGSKGYGRLMGMGAASSKAKELYERGASADQIVRGGLLAGAAEMVFETISLEHLIQMGDATTWKGVIINALKQGGVEASEEMFTEIANTITDAIVMGSQTSYVDFETFLKDVMNAGLGGFISGGLGGGAVSTINKFAYNSQRTQHGQSIIDNGGVDSLQNLAFDMAGDSSIAELSSKVSSKASAKNVGKLSYLIGDTISSQNRVDIENALIEKGLDKREAKRVSEYLANSDDITQAQIDEINSDERIGAVVDELLSNPDSEINTRSLNLLAARYGNYVGKDTSTSKASTESTVENGEKIVTESKTTSPTVSAENSASKTSETVTENIAEEEEKPVTLAEASKKYGAQAQAMIHTYTEGQDVAQYDKAYKMAYDMGRSGVSLSYAMNSESISYLSEGQRKLAYEAGKSASDTLAKEKDAENKQAANGKTGRKKGTVKGENVTIKDLKKTFNDTQNKAYKILTRIAEATGYDIVLFNSTETDAKGNYIEEQGSYSKSSNTIRIDINAGLSNIKDVGDLAKYSMLRTFGHEFTHSLEQNSPVEYNELRKAVFERLTEMGVDVNDLIEQKMALYEDEGLTYEEASREVVAEAMTDILPDSHFIEILATKHQNLFQKILAKLKEFLNSIKEYFKSLDPNSSTEANALKEEINGAMHYVESIVELFDKAAVKAVETYQSKVATEEKATKTTKAETKTEVEKLEEAGIGFDEESQTVYALRHSPARRDASGNVVDLVTVGKKSDGQFVYSIQLIENKKIEASPSLGSPNGVLNRMLNASDDSISQSPNSVNREFLDDGNTQLQHRTQTFSDREVLQLASEEIKIEDLNQAEKDALDIFKKRLAKLESLQEERKEKGSLWHEQQFGENGDRAKAKETLKRMQELDTQIQKAMKDVLSVEEKEVLSRVLKKARKVVETHERDRNQEILKRWRDRRDNAANIKKYRDRIRKDVEDLYNWIQSPDNKSITNHVPEVLRDAVVPFLSSINFMSKRALNGGNATKSDEAFIKNLYKVQEAVKSNITAYGLYSGYTDLPEDFMETLDAYIKIADTLMKQSKGDFIINQMTSEELSSLSKLVANIKQYIKNFNSFLYNSMYQHVYDAGDDSIGFLEGLKDAGDRTGSVSNFLFWQQIRPAYAFERFGKGGEAIYDGLRRGFAKLAFNAQEIVKFTEETYTDKEVNEWEKDIKEFRLGGDILRIPVSYIMGLHELYKDPDGKRHILEGGIRVATYSHKGKKISDNGHTLTLGEFQQITGTLTERQIEVADKLQKHMAEKGAEWGNYVTVARFGEQQFTNPNYYPINSDGRYLPATVEEHPSSAALYALLNMSFTKQRNEKANNRVVIYSIFDVFANHMASMSQYNAMALPILDTLKWFNYEQVSIDDEGNKTILGSLRRQMARVYGVPEETKPGSGKAGYAEAFVTNIIKDFNGTSAQGTQYDTFGLKALRVHNMAQVAYNIRVVAQQPMAIIRAGMLISYKSIIKGMKLNPKAIKNNIEEMRKYSGIAAWKSLGFYDVNISRGLTQVIKHSSTVRDKIADVGMWGAEKADTLTWSAMWSACKEEVIRKQKITPKDKGFFEAVTKLFEDVIYKTQVVDSVLTKNEYMRDKGFVARVLGSFMSESTTNASMLLDAVDKYNLDLKRGMSKREAWQKNGKMIGRRLYVYGLGAVLISVVTAMVDAYRDDDDYEDWYEKWLDAFGGNVVDELMPFNKLPIVSDFYDLAKELASIFGADTYGNPPQSVIMQWYDSLIKGTEIIADKIMGEDINYTWYGGIFKLLQATSGMTGLPMAAATREAISLWNNTVGTFAPSLKVHSYEPSEMGKIRNAYTEGYLTYEEAVQHLLEQGLVDTEDEAYFTVQGWEAGEGYSRYDAIYDAILNGGDFEAAMDELTSHGYTEKEVQSSIKSQVGKWYYDSESDVRITKQQAIQMLEKYTDMDNDEITSTINKWSCVVVTGIKYDDIDDEFMKGNITYSRAIEMYKLYGSMTKEDATEKVEVLKFVKEYPEAEGISYSAVNGYNTYCKPNGVPVETYYKAWKHRGSLTGSGEVKEQMMAYINSLNLSSRQKDSLYFAFGWAESKLYEAPWH